MQQYLPVLQKTAAWNCLWIHLQDTPSRVTTRVLGSGKEQRVPLVLTTPVTFLQGKPRRPSSKMKVHVMYHINKINNV